MPSSAQEVAETITVWERRPFRQVLLSPLGLLLVIFSGGVLLLTLAFVHFFGMPRQLSIRDGRLFSDRFVPVDGAELNDVRLEVVRQTFFGLPVNRCIVFHFRHDNRKKPLLGLNQLYFGRKSLDEVISKLTPKSIPSRGFASQP